MTMFNKKNSDYLSALKVLHSFLCYFVHCDYLKQLQIIDSLEKDIDSYGK